MPPEINAFISYSFKDHHVASAIKHDLQKLGIHCWKAPEDIRPGESWPGAIAKALAVCQVMVLVWSKHSMNSDSVSKELTLAMRNRLLVIPYKIEDVAPLGDWEFHLANSQWLDACVDGIGTANQKLAATLLHRFKKSNPTVNTRRHDSKGTVGKSSKDSKDRVKVPPNPSGQSDSIELLNVSVEELLNGARKRIKSPSRGGRELEILIPPQTAPGKQFRLKGQGEDGRDLILEAVLIPPKDYSVEGNNLVRCVEIDGRKATLGGDLRMLTPNGAIILRIPKGTVSGTYLRVAGRGLPSSDGSRGDFLVKINVVTTFFSRAHEFFSPIHDKKLFLKTMNIYGIFAVVSFPSTEFRFSATQKGIYWIDYFTLVVFFGLFIFIPLWIYDSRLSKSLTSSLAKQACFWIAFTALLLAAHILILLILKKPLFSHYLFYIS